MLTKRLLFAVMFILMLAAGGVQAGGDAARGAELAAADCADCHGDDGMGDEDNPKIAGLDAAKHVELLKGYKSGEIPDEDEMMIDSVSGLSDQDMADLAAYYAGLGG
jgi:cytochrome c553